MMRKHGKVKSHPRIRPVKKIKPGKFNSPIDKLDKISKKVKKKIMKKRRNSPNFHPNAKPGQMVAK